MKHLDFILWVILYPIAMSISEYIDSLHIKKEYTNETEYNSTLISLSIWVIVAFILF